MPGLAQQRLIIHDIEQTTAIQRVRLIEDFRSINPPSDTVDKALRAAGIALIAADMVPGVAAAAGLFSNDEGPDGRRKRLVNIFCEAPKVVRSLRRMLG